MAQRDDHFAATSRLPPALMRHILLRLPLDSRARCACVCRSWREAVDAPELWLRLVFCADMRDYSHWHCFSDTGLRAVTERARGRLETLEVGDRGGDTFLVLRDVVAANAATLRELRLSPDYVDESVLPLLEEMLRTAPALQLSADVIQCGPRNGQPLLSGQPPWDRLRLRMIHLDLSDTDEPAERFAAIAELSSIPELEISGGNGEDVALLLFELPAMEMIADAVLARGVTKLTLNECLPVPLAAPALARLLSSATLTELTLDTRLHSDTDVHWLTAASAELLASALRTNTTLQHLALPHMLLWEDAGAAVALLRALTGHASLRRLALKENTFRNHDGADVLAIGAALGALVAANTALEELNLELCDLRAAGLGPLMAALAHNTNLRVLLLDGNHLSLEFLNQHVVPAVRANTSLRVFDPGYALRSDVEHQRNWEANERLGIRLSAYVKARELTRQAAEKLDEAWTRATGA
jgi:hypothetical protein